MSTKSVLRSVKPYWIYLILIGKKTIEIGKDCPQSEDWDRTVYLYCSKDKKSFNRIPSADKVWMQKYLGKVVLRFKCNKVEEFTVGSLRCADIENLACLTHSEMIEYFYKPDELDGETVKFGYGWHISDIQLFSLPKEIKEFKTLCSEWEKECFTEKCSKCPYYFRNDADICYECCCEGEKPITRPPQSWFYVDCLSVA